MFTICYRPVLFIAVGQRLHVLLSSMLKHLLTYTTSHGSERFQAMPRS